MEKRGNKPDFTIDLFKIGANDGSNSSCKMKEIWKSIKNGKSLNMYLISTGNKEH